MHLPEKVVKIIERLEDAGFEAYAVGGCVRDFLMGREPKDYDITTNALPKEIKQIFRRTIDTGIAHGTVTVMMGKDSFEVTTYRIDGKYSDGRHPDSVEFTLSLEEDLKRRDFTINAMAYNPKTGLVDLMGGREDLKNRIIRTAGDPYRRFGEDALRILRAFRFSAQLDFSIDKDTLTAASDLKDKLSVISAERIMDELTKLLVSPHPEGLLSLYEAGITKAFLPEFDRCMETEQNNPHHKYNVGVHTIESVKNINSKTLDLFKDVLSPYEEEYGDLLKILRFTMLLHDIGKPECRTTDEEGTHHFYGHETAGSQLAKGILKRLKSDNHSLSLITRLIEYHDLRPVLSKKFCRKMANKIGDEAFPLLFPVRYADLMAQSSYKQEEKLKLERDFYRLYLEVLKDDDCLSLKSLAVDGGILIKEAGMKPGRELGKMLDYLLGLVLEDPSWNKKEILLKAVREKLKKETE